MTKTKGFQGLWETIQAQFTDQGFDLESLCCAPEAFKFVCVPSSLRESVEEMGGSARDQVVMVRVDSDTVKALDDWVETGALKSRSEAAALFIREGLKVRDRELRELQDALREVEEAKSKLREKAKSVLGNDQQQADNDEESEEDE